MASQMEFWMDFQNLPKTPEEARLLLTVSREAAAELLPGWTLCSYESCNGGDEAIAGYARVTDGMLRITSLWLTAGGENTVLSESMAVPVSEEFLRRMETEPLEELVETDTTCDSLIDPDRALDTTRIPVGGHIVQNEMKECGLILLTEEEDGRQLIIVSEDGNGGYRMERSRILPADCRMDTYHDGEKTIELEWNDWEMSWQPDTAGKWQPAWAMTSDGMSWNASYGVVTVYTEDEHILRGSLLLPDLLQTDLSDLPGNLTELTEKVSTDGWAVVSNPKKSDRLHLRRSPDKNAASLGKFWNGTMVRVLETKGDWCHVTIGINGALEGWMMKKYLAFGKAMKQVQTVDPGFCLSGRIHLPAQTWSDPWLTQLSDFSLNNLYEASVIGVSEAEKKKPRTFIVMNESGEAGYVPADWFEASAG